VAVGRPGPPTPFKELTRVTEDVNADGVVVGVYVQAGHRFVGSIAIRLVKVGHRPVTVVP
jgi:hypothetical protein